MQLCFEEPGCNTVTMEETACFLKHVPASFDHDPVVDSISILHGASMKLCTEEQNQEPFDESVMTANRPGGLVPGSLHPLHCEVPNARFYSK